MLFNVALFSSLLLSPVVLAVPFELGTRIARRGKSSQGNNRLERATGGGVTPNWAAASLSEVNGTFSGITGTFTVPTPSGTDGSSVAFWLCIDCVTCSSAMLMVGVSAVIGHPTSYAWYQRLPDDGLKSFPDPVQISAGDALNLTLNAWSPTSATVTIENLTNGQVASKALNSSTSLCGQDVEWGVLDYGPADSLTTFADFGTVTFASASATGENTWFSPFGASIVNIKQNNTVLTNVMTNETSVTIQYV